MPGAGFPVAVQSIHAESSGLSSNPTSDGAGEMRPPFDVVSFISRGASDYTTEHVLSGRKELWETALRLIDE